MGFKKCLCLIATTKGFFFRNENRVDKANENPRFCKRSEIPQGDFVTYPTACTDKIMAENQRIFQSQKSQFFIKIINHYKMMILIWLKEQNANLLVLSLSCRMRTL